MNDEINKSRGNNTVAFPHCIYTDINCNRNLSAGVAVAFNNNFGRPSTSNFIN